MILKDKLHGFPYLLKEDGTHVIKCGRWYIEYRPKVEGIFAYSTYVNKDNFGHQIPCELRNGRPYYPFGMHSFVPVYARQAMDMLVKEFGVEVSA